MTSDPHALLIKADALAKRATRGDWSYFESRNDYVITSPRETYFARTEHKDDAAFIAASRTLIPALCAALRQALAENERLRAPIQKETSDDR